MIDRDARARVRMASMAMLIAFLVSGSSHGSAQSQVTLRPVKDNTLYESAAGALSNGAGAHFFAGRTNQASESLRRGVIAFDVAGAVPSGSMVTGVTLTLSMSQTASGGQPVSLHRILAEWGEGTSVALGNEGSGAPATPSDATWIHRFFNTLFWSGAGGDFVVAASANNSVAGIGTYTWGSTAEMVADVQGWLDTPGSNFGWLLRGNESVPGTAKRFDTREHTDSTARPMLTITYTPSVGVRDEGTIAQEFLVRQNYPNPFNPTTTIAFIIGAPAHVTVTVRDILGREVAVPLHARLEADHYRMEFDARDLPSGVYFYTVHTDRGRSETRRMLLLR